MTVTAGLALLVYAVVDAVNAGWGSTATLLRLAGAAVLLVAFVVIELRQRHPADAVLDLPAADAARRRTSSGC